MKTLLLSVSLFIASSLGLSAKTVKFPEKDPAFSVTLPNDWTAEVNKDGNLEGKAGGGSQVGFLLQKLDGKAEEEAKTYLKGIINTIMLGDAKDARISEIKETTTPSGVKLFAITCTGPAAGIEMFYSATAFSPKKETWFAVVTLETAADAKSAEKVMSEILNSLTPASD